MSLGVAPDYREEVNAEGIVRLICCECGAERKAGDWPYCGGDPSRHGTGRFGYEPMEPYVDPFLLDRKDPRVQHRTALGIPGIMIESRGQRRQLMRELGLQFGSNHPGGREI